MFPILKNELFQELIEKLPDAIIVVNESGIIEVTNSKVKQVFGYDGIELVNNNLSVLLPAYIKSTHAQLMKGYFKNPIDKKMGEHRKVMALHKSGNEFEIDITLSALNFENNIYAIASCRDISDKKENEQELEIENYNLQLINKGLEKFGYTVSHDLKAPLAKIEGLLQILTDEIAQGISSDDQKKVIKLINESVVAMKDMISTILEDAQKKQENKDKSLTIVSLFKDVRKLVDLPSKFELKINNNCSPIQGKRSKLRQIFLNLLSNSIKFNDKEVGIVTIDCIENKNEYIITFKDNGPGIPKNKFEDIFKLFEKGIDKKGSHGIGLFTVKTIVESRGGTIKVESNIGEGASFIFTWPKKS